MSAYQDLENSIFLFIAEDMRNVVLDVIMPAASNYLYWIPVLAIFLGYCYTKDKTNTTLLIISAVAAVCLNELLVSQFLKELIMRVRPCTAFPDTTFLGSCTSSYSFPSAHAANSFAIFAATAYFFHRFWHYALAGAVLVSFSRIYLGVHYTSDVLAGAVIGLIVAFGIAAFLEVSFNKQKDKNKKTVW